MIVTIAIALLFAALAAGEVFDKIPKNKQKLAEIGVLLISAFLSCTRYAPMGDYYTYERTFAIMHTNNFWHLYQMHNVFQFELGYYFFMYVCHLTGMSFRMFIAAEGILTNVLLYILAKKMTQAWEWRKEGYPILLFFLFWCFGLFPVIVVRQTIAVLFCYLGLLCTSKKKGIGFLACCLAAFLFHRSSLLWIAAYLLYWIPSQTNKQKGLLFGVWAIGMISAFFALRYLPGILPGTIGEKLRWYMAQENGTVNLVSALKSSANLLFLLLVFTIMLYRQEDQNYHGMYHLFLFGSIFMLVSRFYGEVFSRFATPFNMLSAFLLAQNLLYCKGRKKIVLTLCVTAYALFRLYSFVHGSAMDPVFPTIF